MRTILVGFTIVIITVVSIVIVLSFSGKMIRTNELNHAVNHALFATMKEQFDKDETNYEEDIQLVETFEESLFQQIDSDGDIEIDILLVDAKKGILSVGVSSNFIDLTGNEREIKVEQTVLIEQYE